MSSYLKKLYPIYNTRIIQAKFHISKLDVIFQ